MSGKTFFKTAGFYLVKTLYIAILVTLLLINMVFGFIYYCNVTQKPVPKIGNVRMYMILSDSMSPYIRVDDAIAVIATDPAKLQVGDVIAFTAFESNIAITHRITSTTKSEAGYEFTTKGDKNFSEDTFVTPEDRVIGKLFLKITGLAAVIRSIQSNPLLIVIPVIITIIILYALDYWAGLLKPLREPTPEEVVNQNGDAAVLDPKPIDVDTDGKTPNNPEVK